MPLAGENVFDFLIRVITTTIHYDSFFCVAMFCFLYEQTRFVGHERVWPAFETASTLSANIFPNKIRNEKKTLLSREGQEVT